MKGLISRDEVGKAKQILASGNITVIRSASVQTTIKWRLNYGVHKDSIQQVIKSFIRAIFCAMRDISSFKLFLLINTIQNSI